MTFVAEHTGFVVWLLLTLMVFSASLAFMFFTDSADLADRGEHYKHRSEASLKLSLFIGMFSLIVFGLLVYVVFCVL